MNGILGFFSPKLAEWQRQHGNAHRTIRQGTVIVCTVRDKRQMIQARQLEVRVTGVTSCPICHQSLQRAEPITSPPEHREFQWKAA